MIAIKGKGGTHVVNDGIFRNAPYGVLDVLFDESTESGVIELGRPSIRIRRTVFPKLDNFIAEDKVNRQEMRESWNGRFGGEGGQGWW